MSISWTHYKEKKILRLDYTGMDEEAMLKQLQGYHRILPAEREIRQLSDFGETMISKTFVETAKRLAAENPDGQAAKMALLGIHRHQRARVFTFNFQAKANAQVFESEVEALEWLASD
ncbi:hypothetical protein [Geomonas azotofigens]|uniref:hypothetical protein n=1 Tax=Geomonas azotofigens TaxID=2843196 RepID=UPI001C11ACBF|nr:hypothetical protein [Geomonas azotofigens]MBU5613871.1 hypothetical protein [Geomonas azotofigens]